MDPKLTKVTHQLPLDFRWRIQRQGEILVDGESYTPEFVVEALAPLISEERKAKIEAVVAKRTWEVIIAGDQLYDVGNISALMRTAESFGYLQFKILERQGSRYKKSDRISRGSEKWLDLEKTKEPIATLKTLKTQGYKIFATSLEGDEGGTQDLSQPLVMILGNEKDGVSPEVLAEADELVRLPMCGFTQSYNISVAGSLVMQQIFQQRQEKLENPYKKSKPEEVALLAQYYLRSVGDSRILRELKSKANNAGQ